MENRFDEVTKALAESVSRRDALRRIGGGLAGALLASVGIGAFGGKRAVAQVICNTTNCPPPRRCCIGVLDAPGVAGAVCRDLLSDSSNCCACGNACPDTKTCVNGKCVCKPGFTAVGRGCCPNERFCPRNTQFGKCCPDKHVCLAGAFCAPTC